MKISLPKIYSQNDNQWKNKTLGTKGTIGAYGCLLTCIAMTCCYFGHDETPDSLNEKLKANGGYLNGNLYVWGALNKIFSDIKYQGQTSTPDPLTTSQMNFIRSKIDAGYPVILQIDTIPATAKLDEHWVLVIDYDGDDFILADPWDGAVKRITSWGVKPQQMIYAYAYYTGKPVKPQPNELTECLSQHTILVNLCNKKDQEITDLKDQIKNYKDAEEKFKKQLSAQQDEVERQKMEIKSLTAEISTLDDKVIAQNKVIELAQNKLTSALAEKDLGCQKKIEDARIRMSADFEGKENEYRKTIEDLEKQVKEKEIIVEKPEVRPKTFKGKLIAIIEILFS